MNINVTLVNMADPQQRMEQLFRVDHGVINCIAPGALLRFIGIVPRSRRYRLVDASQAILEVGSAELELMGEIIVANIVFGGDDCEPILGLAALQSAGIEVVSRHQRFVRLPAIQLKSFLGKRSVSMGT